MNGRVQLGWRHEVGKRVLVSAPLWGFVAFFLSYAIAYTIAKLV